MMAALAGKDGRLKAHIFPLSFQKPTDTTVKGFFKSHKDNKNGREDNNNRVGS